MLRNATTEAQVDDLEALFYKVVETAGNGVLAKCDRWGKLKLAHPVEHKDYAYFVLFRYKIPKTQVVTFPKELGHLLKVKQNAVVVRFVTKELQEEVFVAPYKRPEAFIPSSSSTSSRGFGSERTSFSSKKSFTNDSEDHDSSVDNVAGAINSVDS
jgi:ribosomal protein S6